jgi:hypothetical protein
MYKQLVYRIRSRHINVTEHFQKEQVSMTLYLGDVLLSRINRLKLQERSSGINSIETVRDFHFQDLSFRDMPEF